MAINTFTKASIKEVFDQIKRSVSEAVKSLEEYKKVGVKTEEEVNKAVMKHEDNLVKLSMQRKAIIDDLKSETTAVRKLATEYNKLKDANAKSKAKLTTLDPGTPEYKSIATSLLAGSEKEDVLGVKYFIASQKLVDLDKQAIIGKERLNRKISEEKKNISELTTARLKDNDGLMDFSKRMDVAIQKIITYRLAFGAYKEIANTIKTTIDEVYKLNDATQELRKVLNANEKTFASLRKEAFSLGIVFGKSASEITDGFVVFAQQGLNAAQILDRMNAVLLLTASSSLATTAAVEALTAVVQSYPEFVDNASAAVEKWAAVQAAFPVTAADLANGMKTVGITAKEVGISLDELNGIIASVAAVTRKSGTAVAQSFKTVFARIPREETIKLLQREGIAVMETADSYRPFGDILLDINNAWAGMSEQMRFNIAETIGGVRRYSDFQALMGNFDDYIRATTTSLVAQDEAIVMTQSELEKYKVQLKSASTYIQQTLLPVLENLAVKGLVNASNSFAKFVLVMTESKGAFVAGAIGAGIMIAAISRLKAGLAQLQTAELATIISTHGLRATFLALLVPTKALDLGVTSLTIKMALLKASMGPIALVLGTLIPMVVSYFIAKQKLRKETEQLSKALSGEAEELELLRLQTQQGLDSGLSFDTLVEQKQLIDRANLLAEEGSVILNAIKERELEKLQLAEAEKNGNDEQVKAIKAGVESRKKERDKELLDLEKQAKKQQDLLSKTQKEINKFSGADSLVVPTNPTEVSYPFGSGNLVDLHETIYSKDAIRLAKEQEDALNKTKRELELANVASKESADLTARKNALEVEYNEIMKRQGELLAQKSPKAFIQFLSKYVEKVYEASTVTDNLKNTLKSLGSVAQVSGDSFIESQEKIKSLTELYKTFEDIKNGIQNDIKVNEIKLQIYPNLANSEREKISDELKSLYADLALVTKEAETQQIKIRKDIADTLPLYANVLELQNESALVLERQKNLDELRFSALNAYGRGFGKLSSQKALDLTVTQRIISEELKALDVKEEQLAVERALIEAQLKNAKGEKTIEDQKKKQLELDKQINALNRDRAELYVKMATQTQKAVENIQDEVAKAFSSAFASIPNNIVKQQQEINKITADRKEAEKELAKAIASNDEAAIVNAKNRLIDLSNQIKSLKPVWVDLFGSIGDIALKRWGEQFANAILLDKANDFLASGILPASVLGAQRYYEAIINSTEIMSKILDGNKLLDVTQTIPGVVEATYEGKNGEKFTDLVDTKINLAGGKVADKWETAIETGGNLAAVTLIKAMGIGTGEISNALSNFGGMLGGAAGKDLLGGAGGALGSFAGPLGVIVGSLLGAGIGALFEKKPTEKLDENTQAMAKNTAAIENNNKLLSLQREFINAPTNYTPPPLYGISGAQVGSININISGANPQTIGKEVTKAVEEAYLTAAKTGQTTFNRFGK